MSIVQSIAGIVIVLTVVTILTFEKCAAIENPASCEVQSLIWFLLALHKTKPIKIYPQGC